MPQPRNTATIDRANQARQEHHNLPTTASAPTPPTPRAGAPITRISKPADPRRDEVLQVSEDAERPAAERRAGSQDDLMRHEEEIFKAVCEPCRAGIHCRRIAHVRRHSKYVAGLVFLFDTVEHTVVGGVVDNQYLGWRRFLSQQGGNGVMYPMPRR